MLKSEEIRWFAIRVRPRHENTVARLIYSKGLDVFSPVWRSRNRWADRIKTVSLPLFPGYLFARFAPIRLAQVVSTAGVTGVVSFGRQLAPVDDEEIANLRRLTDTSLSYQPRPYLGLGERVRLCYGPLSGVEGILEQVKGRLRVVISVELLRRSVAVEVDRDWAIPLRTQFPMAAYGGAVLSRRVEAV